MRQRGCCSADSQPSIWVITIPASHFAFTPIFCRRHMTVLAWPSTVAWQGFSFG